MSNRAPSRGLRLSRRLARRPQTGAATLEMALVFGVFVFILYGLIAFGMMLAVKQSITNAAAEAARAAVGSTDAGAAQQSAKATVTQRLDWLGAKFDPDDAGQFQATAVPCVASGPPDCIKVTVTYQYASHPLVPPAPGLNLITPDRFSSEATVKFK